jgi:hypothetical protein
MVNLTFRQFLHANGNVCHVQVQLVALPEGDVPLAVLLAGWRAPYPLKKSSTDGFLKEPRVVG